MLPVFVLISTKEQGDQKFGGAVFIIGLAIAYGLLATSIVGYALTVARDREKGVFQRLRVTPAPTWTIMASRLAMQAVANLILALVVVIVGSRIHRISPSLGQYVLVLLVSILGGGGVPQHRPGARRPGQVRRHRPGGRAGAVRRPDPARDFSARAARSAALGPVARWSPVGAVMTLFAGVLNLHAWYSRDTLALLACAGYIVVFAGIGIRWFQWDAR